MGRHLRRQGSSRALTSALDKGNKLHQRRATQRAAPIDRQHGPARSTTTYAGSGGLDASDELAASGVAPPDQRKSVTRYDIGLREQRPEELSSAPQHRRRACDVLSHHERRAPGAPAGLRRAVRRRGAPRTGMAAWDAPRVAVQSSGLAARGVSGSAAQVSA